MGNEFLESFLNMIHHEWLTHRMVAHTDMHEPVAADEGSTQVVSLEDDKGSQIDGVAALAEDDAQDALPVSAASEEAPIAAEDPKSSTEEEAIAAPGAAVEEEAQVEATAAVAEAEEAPETPAPKSPKAKRPSPDNKEGDAKLPRGEDGAAASEM